MALHVTSTAFVEGGWIPVRHTGRGEDLSPDFILEGIDPGAKSIAITLDDADHPIPNYNHWLIWNIPVGSTIPEGISPGKAVESLGGAVQGIGYGKHRYRGPKPPFRWIHRYVFTVYILDCFVDLSPDSMRRALINRISDHVLQQATLTGKFQSNRKEN